MIFIGLMVNNIFKFYVERPSISMGHAWTFAIATAEALFSKRETGSQHINYLIIKKYISLAMIYLIIRMIVRLFLLGGYNIEKENI